MNLQQILENEFNFKRYSAHHSQPDQFINYLSQFGTFKLYGSFNDYLRDENLDIIITSEHGFNLFMEEYSYIMDELNSLSYEDIKKPFLFAEANSNNMDNIKHHFALLNDINSESDLIGFINEVLRELGEVTHSTGIKNEYEVTGITQ